ncbi:TonB family protein [Rheinheimera baltica]|uniref:TonB family protein n=1 Tax=Rheinheimera baltica TaxID=67576 RepID=UPI00273F96A0|nr:TonB family protein [Rheinheimera baltica]MDP5144730.1 TonB family protein [Rheinheimera baltica]
MKKWIWLALLSCGAVQADMLDALKAYEQKNYIDAQQQFAELLPLGNELAAFNLGVMAYQAEGQPQDLTKALTYFMLAADLRHEQAKNLLARLAAQASEQQLELANQEFERLKQRVAIVATDLTKSRNANAPEPIRRVHPDYPIEAARQGQFGYVALRFLVDEQGEVTAVDTMDAYPKKVFEKSSIQALKRWRFEPSGQKHLMNVRLNYSFDGGVKLSAVENMMEQHKLWEYAALGAPEYQLALGTLLSLIEIQSPNSFWYDPDMPLAATPDFSIYTKHAVLRPDFDGFWGRAIVRVAEDGTITEQIKADFEPGSELTSLVGLKLKGKVETDVYRVARSSTDGARRVYVTPSIQTSRAMSGMFWWEQAAKNGNLDAQRVMAAYDAQWENYLLSQQDAEVMAWTGTRLIINGQREQGMALLEQAIAKNYQPAKEMKKQFM